MQSLRTPTRVEKLSQRLKTVKGRLILNLNYMRVEDIELLSVLENVPDVDVVDLRGNRITAQGVSYLVGTELPLKAIYLGDNSIRDKGLQVLLSIEWPQLTCLTLGQNHLTGQGLFHFVNACLPALEELILNSNTVGLQGARHISQLKCPLKTLQMNKNGLEDTECIRILAQGLRANLEYLQLSMNGFGNQGVRELSQSSWHSLKQLYIRNNKVSNNGIRWLVRGFPQLTGLFLDGNSLESQGISTLIKGKWPKLLRLQLSQNNINDTGLEYLLKGHWPKMIEFNIEWNPFSPQAARKLLMLALNPHQECSQLFPWNRLIKYDERVQLQKWFRQRFEENIYIPSR